MSVDRKPRVAEVAARAGVSLATVDRVLNGRGGVAPHTVARVEEALRNFDGQGKRASAEDVSPCRVLLAGDGSAFVRLLTEEMTAALGNVGVSAEMDFVDRQNPTALIKAIATAVSRGCKSLVVQAVDTVEVRHAIDDAVAAGITVVTVTTDVPNSRRHAYVGLDNRAAGRTAGLLMARFCHAPGTLAVVWGGQTYRSHEERDSGFRGVLRAERPDLPCLEVITGDYTPPLARRLTSDVISSHPDLVGIYCVGGGIAGVAEAVAQCDRAKKPVLIGHNYNVDTRQLLIAGTLDAVVHQDVPRIAANVVDALLDQSSAATRAPIRTEIITRENLA